ncbi:hypothetical protein ACVIGA_006165 [Bradyrhizobium sp. USDA 3240]
MPRYFFDLRDGDELVPDEEGLELKSIQSAQLEAARSLADMARDELYDAQPKNTRNMAIEVRDETGPVMDIRLTFKVEKGSK